MKLTPHQKRYIAALFHFKTRQPTVWRLMAFRPRSWLPLAAVTGMSIWFYFSIYPTLGLFMIGMMMGAVARTFGQARFSILAWPVTREVTDWSKVEALANDLPI